MPRLFAQNPVVPGWRPAASRRPVMIHVYRIGKGIAMPTQDNLQAAFAGESQANRKYLAFARKAGKDGFPQVGKLFRAAAAAETIHAHAHLRVMGGVSDTAANLRSAIDGEGYEFQQMYPEFIKEAEAAGNKAATITFKNAMVVEEVHHGLYSQAAEAVADGKDLDAAKIFVCDVCGNTVLGAPEDKCSVCGAAKERFFEVE